MCLEQSLSLAKIEQNIEKYRCIAYLPVLYSYIQFCINLIKDHLISNKKKNMLMKRKEISHWSKRYVYYPKRGTRILYLFCPCSFFGVSGSVQDFVCR